MFPALQDKVQKLGLYWSTWSFQGEKALCLGLVVLLQWGPWCCVPAPWSVQVCPPLTCTSLMSLDISIPLVTSKNRRRSAGINNCFWKWLLIVTVICPVLPSVLKKPNTLNVKHPTDKGLSAVEQSRNLFPCHSALAPVFMSYSGATKLLMTKEWVF